MIDPMSGSTISELPKELILLFSPIERQPVQELFHREIRLVFAR